MPRSIAHWTSRYILSRLSVMYDEWRNPNNPWLTRDAVKFLNQVLKPTDVALEFGSGRSSIWFARRIGRLISVEDNNTWNSKVTALIVRNNLAEKIDLRLREPRSEYVAQVETFVDSSLDLCLVDGSHRDECALRVIPKIKPGGFLAVDNINWYLPSDTLTPSSRGPSDGCATAEWATFAETVSDWRQFWTSNGIQDTCIWLKPCAYLRI